MCYFVNEGASGGTPYSMQPDDVVNVALEAFRDSITNKSRTANLSIDPRTREEIEKIIKDALHSKMQEITVKIQSESVSRDQICRGSEELANSTIDQAKRDKRTTIYSGDVVLAFMDLGVKGYFYPFCKSELTER